MASLSGPGLFTSIERKFTNGEPASGLRLDSGFGTAGVPLSPAEARPILYDRSVDPTVRTSLWRQAVALARVDAGRSDWPLCVVWLALPGLRRTAFRITDRFGTPREDVEAELATACLETLREMGPETSDPGSVLLRSACTRAWNMARPRAEVAVEDVDAVTGPRHGRHDDWQVDFERAESPGGLSAPLRITVPADRAEGIRVGALAEEWGLAGTAGDTRRLRRGRRVGTLSLRGPRGRR
ncbi:hypothetical protein [Streptomyces sp. NPDC057496]|uniref:hypothetical protein n=1 Tax=Streptomyces sp. NPDC057496 TaxID=3346149 RepID=UPI00367CAC0F